MALLLEFRARPGMCYGISSYKKDVKIEWLKSGRSLFSFHLMEQRRVVGSDAGWTELPSSAVASFSGPEAVAPAGDSRGKKEWRTGASV